MSLTLNHALNRTSNNFDLVRLLAATAVVYSHSFILFPAGGQTEPIRVLLRGQGIGEMGVWVFFFLSGLLVSQSFLGGNGIVGFVIRRAFRIWPALIVCLCLTVFLLGPFFTVEHAGEYFQSRLTWHYLLNNGTLYRYQADLPGVFMNHPFTEVNGPIWTLPMEIRCYLMLLIFGMLKMLDSKFRLVLACLLLWLFSTYAYHIAVLDRPATWFFLGGMLAHVFRKEIVLKPGILLLLTAICFGGYFISFKIFMPVFCISFLYAILILATSAIAIRMKLPADLSYGLYIFSFPVQQMLAAFFPAMGHNVSLLPTFGIGFALAAASWSLVELPSIKTGRRLSESWPLNRKPQPAV